MRALAAGLAFALVFAAPGADARAATRVPGTSVGSSAAPLPAPPGSTTLVSAARTGGFGDARSYQPSISAGGRFVAFTSFATNLVANDQQGTLDVFVLDRRSGKITRAPLPDGVARSTQTPSTEPSISADGRIVAFTYQAAPPAGVGTVFVAQTYVVAWNRANGNVTYVSASSRGGPLGGASEPSISADGRYVAYTSIVDFTGDKDGGQPDVVRYDRQTGTTILVSSGLYGRPIAGSADSPSISGDGNLVAFLSDGGDTIVPENTGEGTQVYVRDIAAGTTERISAAADGGPALDIATNPAISGDGRYVVFSSSATNLTPDGAGGLFRRDRQASSTILVSVAPDGSPGIGASVQGSITPDGNFVAWTSLATNLVAAAAGGIVPAATSRIAVEVYLRDIAAGETVLISVTPAGAAGSGRSLEPAVGGGGRLVAFTSDSAALVTGDDNEVSDVFLRDLPPVPAINPPSLDLGQLEVGTESLPLAATLANGGWSPLDVARASITGPAKADFRVVANACRDRRLLRDEACTVTVVFKPTAQGNRTATLEVADAYKGSPRTVRLRGIGTVTPVVEYHPKLTLSPPLGQPGIVTIVTGTGFPPGATVRLSWTRGITLRLPQVVADGMGAIRVPVLVFHNDLTGRRDLLADHVDGTAFPSATASMLVTRPSAIPPRFILLRIIDLPLALVIRG